MYHPKEGIKALNKATRMDIQWRLSGNAYEMKALFATYSDFIPNIQIEGEELLEIQGFRDTTVKASWYRWEASWYKKMSDADIHVIYRHDAFCGPSISEQLSLDNVEDVLVPSSTLMLNRYFYCLFVAVMIRFKSDMKLCAYSDNEGDREYLMVVKSYLLPTYDEVIAELTGKGVNFKDKSIADEIDELFGYLWLNLPYDFTGKDTFLKRKSIEKADKLFSS